MRKLYTYLTGLILVFSLGCASISSLDRFEQAQDHGGVRFSIASVPLSENIEKIKRALSKELGNETVFINQDLYNRKHKVGLLYYEYFRNGYESHPFSSCLLMFDGNIYISTTNRAENEKLAEYFLQKHLHIFTREEEAYIILNYGKYGTKLPEGFDNEYPY